jgi:hypothetical protein
MSYPPYQPQRAKSVSAVKVALIVVAAGLLVIVVPLAEVLWTTHGHSSASAGTDPSASPTAASAPYQRGETEGKAYGQQLASGLTATGCAYAGAGTQAQAEWGYHIGTPENRDFMSGFMAACTKAAGDAG